MMRLLTLVFCLFIVSPVHAEKDSKPSTVSPSLYKKLNKAEQLISKKSYQQAEQKLNSILKSVKKNSYGQAVTLRSLASVYALNGKHKKATQTLLKAIRLNSLPDKQNQNALLNLGRLYMATEDYAKAVQTLEPWLAKNANPDAQMSALLANAYAQLKQYRRALPHIKKAIASSKKPSESWLQLNLALYYELKIYPPASKMLAKLIQLHPDKRSYWDQLSSVYQQQKDYKKAASIKHLAYQKGLISTEKELIELANLFLYIGSPYKAANILKKELNTKRIKGHSKNWEKLAQAWQAAKEFDRAINALETASKLNNKGYLYQRLGQIYVAQEKWKLAIKSLNKALAKGSLKNTGSTYILLGMSHYELNKLTQAKKYFSKATRYQKNKKAALQWLNYIENGAETNQS